MTVPRWPHDLPPPSTAPAASVSATLVGLLCVGLLGGCDSTQASSEDATRTRDSADTATENRSHTNEETTRSGPEPAPPKRAVDELVAEEPATAPELSNAATAASEPTSSDEEGKTVERMPPTDGVPRVYAKSRNVWVRGKPTTDTQWIGFLWFGNSVELKDPNPIPGHGCKTWYAIKPRGYVCVDGERATLDPSDPVLQQIYRYGPNPDSPTPHPHYGESLDAQRYHHLPSEKQMRAREWDYRLVKERVATALAGGELHETLLGVDLTQTNEPVELPETFPRGVREGHKRLIRRSAVAWSREIVHEGRSLLLADDLTWVPKDRIVPYPDVTFEGVHLSDDVKLPIAFFRDDDRPKYRRNDDGEFVELEQTYERLSWVQLSDERATSGEHEFAKTRQGEWLRVDQAVIPEPREETPWGAPLYAPDETGKGPKGRHTWMHVSILGGWLVAFEGTKPVFATLTSPGSGGPPHGDIPTLKTASTPTGWFKITGKFVTATMIAPNDLVHSAVPWAQNFKGPYALHGAYWHDEFGKPKSGGCLNVSPKDGKWLFDFTEPRIPEGWHGVRWLPDEEGASGLIVDR